MMTVADVIKRVQEKRARKLQAIRRGRLTEITKPTTEEVDASAERWNNYRFEVPDRAETAHDGRHGQVP